MKISLVLVSLYLYFGRNYISVKWVHSPGNHLSLWHWKCAGSTFRANSSGVKGWGSSVCSELKTRSLSFILPDLPFCSKEWHLWGKGKEKEAYFGKKLNFRYTCDFKSSESSPLFLILLFGEKQISMKDQVWVQRRKMWSKPVDSFSL